MEKLHEIKDALIDLVYSKKDCLECVNAEEMGAIIDMIKDIYECHYYCAATEEKEEEHETESTAEVVKAIK